MLLLEMIFYKFSYDLKMTTGLALNAKNLMERHHFMT